MKKQIYFNGKYVGDYESVGDNEADLITVQKYLDSKGLRTEVSLVQAMFGQANSFAHLAIDIYEKDLKPTPIKIKGVTPFVVNSAFAIEIYLKTIYGIFGKPPRGHHLFKLFEGLNVESKNSILVAAELLQPQYALEKGWDINTCFESLNQSFEEWRYIYEQSALNIEVQSVRYLMHVVGHACHQMLDTKHLL